MDLCRVGEEALIESIQALTIAPPALPPLSSSLLSSFFWDTPRNSPSTPSDSGTAALGNRVELKLDIAISMSALIPAFTSGTIRLWFVILNLKPFDTKLSIFPRARSVQKEVGTE